MKAALKESKTVASMVGNSADLTVDSKAVVRDSTMAFSTVEMKVAYLDFSKVCTKVGWRVALKASRKVILTAA